MKKFLYITITIVVLNILYLSYMHFEFGWEWHSTQLLGSGGIALAHVGILIWWPRRWMSWVLLMQAFLLALYAIVNTVYFPIFHNVLPLHFLENIRFSGSMIVDFYASISLLTYLFSLLYLGVLVWLYRQSLAHMPEHVFFYSKKIHRRGLALLVISFAVISIVGVRSVSAKEREVSFEAQGIGITFFEQIYNQYYESKQPVIISEQIESAPFLSARRVEQGRVPDLPSINPHIIIYQLESVPTWALKYGIEAMPFLKSLQSRAVDVPHTYPNGCHTIDAEFTILCSQYPHSYRPIASIGTEFEYQCLPHILAEKGYQSSVYHANEPRFWSRDELFPAWGIDDLFFVPDAFDTPKVDDIEVVDYAMDYLALHQDVSQFLYLIGYSSHGPHIHREMEFLRKVSGTDIDFYDGPIDPMLTPRVDLPTEGDIRAYMGFLEPIDRAIQHLFERLENQGLAENTIVIITGDHRYYGFVDHLEEEDDFVDMNQVPLLIIFPDDQGSSNRQMISHIDVAPTLLHTLEGDDYQARDIFLGTSIFEGKDGDEVVMTCDKFIHAISNEGEIGYTNQEKAVAYSVVRGPYLADEKRDEGLLRLREYVLGRNLLVTEGRLYENN